MLIIDTSNIRRKAAGLRATVTKLPEIISAQARAAGSAIVSIMASYPSQLPPKDPRRRYIRGVGMQTVSTGHIQRTSQRYGATIRLDVNTEGDDVIMTIRQPATYSGYVRGGVEGGGQVATPSMDDGIRQAQQHQRNWDTNAKIINDELPKAAKRIEANVSATIDRA